MKARVGVIGATGYAGAELVRLLAGHPSVELSVITSRQYGGQAFSQVYPAMAGVVDLVCEPYDADRIAEMADLFFIALPHKVPMGIVPALLEMGKKVVDLSADFRFDDVERYEAHYQPHTAGELLARSVYGLSDVYHEEIAKCDLVGNPGREHLDRRHARQRYRDTGDRDRCLSARTQRIDHDSPQPRGARLQADDAGEWKAAADQRLCGGRRVSLYVAQVVILPPLPRFRARRGRDLGASRPRAVPDPA